MAQVTIDMCDHIIGAADKQERFPLTVNEMRQLAYLARQAIGLLKDPVATLDEPDTDAEVIVKMRAKIREAMSWDGGYSPHPSGEGDRP